MLVVFTIRPYSEGDLTQLIRLYQAAFAEPPWDEYMKCNKCGINYGISEVIESSVTDRREKEWPYKEPSTKDCKGCGTDLRARITPIIGGAYARTSENFVPFWSEEDITSDLNFALSQPQPIVLVAEADKALVGMTWGYQLPLEKFYFLRGKVDDRSIYMDEIAVEKKNRLQGIGARLLNQAAEITKEKGLSGLVARTDERNQASMALVRKVGFLPVPNTEDPGGSLYDPEFPNRIYIARRV